MRRPLPGAAASSRWFPVAAVVVFVLGAVARLGVTFAGAGPSGNYGYDAAVYYAAGDALTHGWLPYRDFVLLHPPGIMLTLTPFAWLGNLTTDHAGYIAGNMAFCVIGALNGVLVLAVGRRMGLRRAAVVGAAVFYAVWYGSVAAEYMIRLEPLGNTFVLLALLAYFGPDRPVRGLRCGLALGAAVAIKIWFVVPLVVLLAALAARHRGRTLVAAVGGAAGVIVACYLPFFAGAPRSMSQMVVGDQVSRVSVRPSLAVRLTDMSGVGPAFPSISGAALVAVSAAFGAFVAAALAFAYRVRRARVIMVLAVAQLVVLLTAPPWFRSYTDFVGPALALSAGAAAHVALGRRRAVGGLWAAPVAAAAAVSVVAMVVSPLSLVTPFPGARLAAATAGVRCVMSDSPMALVELDVLGRSFAPGCRNYVDVVGRVFGADAPDRPGIPRAENARWQADLRDYLTSGDAVVLVQAPITGLSAATLAAVQSGPLIAAAGPYRVYRTGR